MRKRILWAAFLALAGCSGSAYLPYASKALPPAQLNAIIRDASQANAVPPALTNAVVMAESGGNPSAVSSAGAQGLMQLMPATAADCGIGNPFEPRGNVDCGTRYLHGLLLRYNNNVELAVAAYNAGPGAVDSYHGVPPYTETRQYVARVVTAYHNY
ncbi:MAG: transglycosylase SLT domain-containing protein [Candidatus Eremiobacteraeota bacterium]|nr:transglycosylase SLT domain-containing protein [Candidatus Eremiobacteraeota bacterium]